VLKIRKRKAYPDDLLRRRGRFNVSRDLIDAPSHILFEFFKNFIIVRAEFMYDSDSIEYIAVSWLFSPIEKGIETPDYNFEITEQEDGSIEIKARRLSDEKGKKLLRLLRKLDG